MAIVGVSSSFIAKYNENDGTPNYTDGKKFARMTSIDNTVTTNEEELFSDDCLEDADYSFSGGTLKVDVSDLEDGVVSDITGATANEITVDGEKVSEIVYDDDRQETEFGFGFVVEKKNRGVFSYRAIVLPRIKFKLPDVKVTTRGKTLTFQTRSVEATVHRDHSEKHRWKREATFAKKESAVSYIKQILGMTETAQSQEE